MLSKVSSLLQSRIAHGLALPYFGACAVVSVAVSRFAKLIVLLLSVMLLICSSHSLSCPTAARL